MDSNIKFIHKERSYRERERKHKNKNYVTFFLNLNFKNSFNTKIIISLFFFKVLYNKLELIMF